MALAPELETLVLVELLPQLFIPEEELMLRVFVHFIKIIFPGQELGVGRVQLLLTSIKSVVLDK